MCEYTIPLIVPQDLDWVECNQYWRVSKLWTLTKPQTLMVADDFLTAGREEHKKFLLYKPSDWHHYLALASKSNRYKPPQKPRKPIKKKPRKRTKKR